MSEAQMIRDRVSFQLVDGVAEVRLARPDRMNALDSPMMEGLADALALVKASNATAVVLSGEGRAFCSGLDKAMFTQMTSGHETKALPDLIPRTHGAANLFQHIAVGWRDLPIPVIAAVHGVAFGGGLQIALGADVRYVAPDTRCSVMEIRWGLVPDMGGMVLLPGLVRDDVLRDLLFTGRIFDGVEAAAIGIATHVTDDPLAAARASAHAIAAFSPSAIRAAKRLANRAWAEDRAAILLAESQEQQKIIGGDDQREAVAAAMAGRQPCFVARIVGDDKG